MYRLSPARVSSYKVCYRNPPSYPAPLTATMLKGASTYPLFVSSPFLPLFSIRIRPCFSSVILFKIFLSLFLNNTIYRIFGYHCFFWVHITFCTRVRTYLVRSLYAGCPEGSSVVKHMEHVGIEPTPLHPYTPKNKKRGLNYIPDFIYSNITCSISIHSSCKIICFAACLKILCSWLR